MEIVYTLYQEDYHTNKHHTLMLEREVIFLMPAALR